MKMSMPIQIATFFWFASAAMPFVYEGWAGIIPFVASSLVFGFVVWIEVRKIDDLGRIEDRFKRMDLEHRDLKEQVAFLKVGRR